MCSVTSLPVVVNTACAPYLLLPLRYSKRMNFPFARSASDLETAALSILLHSTNSVFVKPSGLKPKYNSSIVSAPLSFVDLISSALIA